MGICFLFHPVQNISWILDSTCYFRVIPNKDWFNIYRLINYGFVSIGNDASCKVIGIWNIKIKMFDGVVRTLCDVRHVPNLRKNLISLGVLNSNEFCYKSKSEVMKVSKDSMIVMKDKKLQGISIGCWVLQL